MSLSVGVSQIAARRTVHNRGRSRRPENAVAGDLYGSLPDDSNLDFEPLSGCQRPRYQT